MPWTRKRASSTLARLLLEDADELGADDLALRLGLVLTGERVEEALLGVDVDQLDPELLAERLDDLVGLALSHQAVVDEHAGELVADRPVDEHRRDRRIDAAGEAADDLAVADLLADLRDLLVDHRRRRPALLAAGDLAQEALEDLLAVRGVDDLGVELDAVEAALERLERRDRRSRAGSERRQHPPAPRARSRGGSSSTAAPRAGRRAGWPPSPVSVSVVRPNSPASAPSTLPPSASAIACIP